MWRTWCLFVLLCGGGYGAMGLSGAARCALPRLRSRCRALHATPKQSDSASPSSPTTPNQSLTPSSSSSSSSSPPLAPPAQLDLRNSETGEAPGAELRDEIERQIRQGAPSEVEVRMQVMGVSSWTLAGFALAAAIIVLNNSLGAGWASQLLGWGDDDVVGGPNRRLDTATLFQDLGVPDVGSGADYGSSFGPGKDLDPRLQRRVQELQRLQDSQ